MISTGGWFQGRWTAGAGVVVALLACVAAVRVEARPFPPRCVHAPEAAGCEAARPLLVVSAVPAEAEGVTPPVIDVLESVMDSALDDGLVRVDERRGLDGHEPRVPGIAVVPEPASLLLLGTGLAAVAGVVRRRRRVSNVERG